MRREAPNAREKSQNQQKSRKNIKKPYSTHKKSKKITNFV